MKVALLVLFVVWVMLILRLPKPERKVWKTSLSGEMLASLLAIEFSRTQNSFESVPIAVGETIGICVFLPVVHVFKPDIMQHPHLQGAGYSILLSMQRDKSKTLDTFDKFKWFLWFRKHGVRTPAVVAIVTGGVVQLVTGEPPITNQKYIFKPKAGSQGIDLTFETLESFQQRRHVGSFIMQERVYDCEEPGATRSYRLISVSDGATVYACMLFEQRHDGGAVKTNEHAGGTKVFCPNFRCAMISRATHKKIDLIMAELVELHRKEFLFVPSIGWDFMVCCDGAYALEGNVHAGIASRKTPGYKQILRDNDAIMQTIYNREP